MLLTMRTYPQQGISFVVSLVMLLIMTTVGISAMNISISNLKMTGGIQQQSFVSNSSEESLLIGEGQAENPPASFAFITSQVDFYDKTAWTSAKDGTTDDSQYMVEYLGKRIKNGGDVTTGVGTVVPGDSIHVYRVTARSIAGNNTTRMLQSLYLSENGPK
jgi:Tfp pilus assembly protein PilX